MGDQTFVYVILALAFLVGAGGLLFWGVGYIRDRGKASSKGRERPSTAGASAGREPPAPAGEQELLRVSRTKRGEMVVFVQGQRYRHLREIKNPQVGRETIEAFKAVLAFAKGWLPELREGVSQSTPRESTVDEEAFLEQLRQSELFPLDRVLPGRRRQPGQSPSAHPPSPLLTPADAINDLVQQRLEERPDLTRYNIRLTTGEDGGLRIHVGLQTFAAIGDVPDPEVQALIQDAIHEWESD